MTAVYTYDGDGRAAPLERSVRGNRIKTVVNGVTVTYIGNYFEWSNSVGTKYYYAGSVRVAVRVGTVLDYLFSDHLGSTSITADSAGNLAGGMRYTAFGETRYTAGTTPTTFRYTGQRQAEAGLYYYVARYYDPALGRFSQADTLVPKPGSPVAWDRYAYVNNSPINYTDPSGNMVDDGCDNETCKGNPDATVRTILLGQYHAGSTELEQGSDKTTPAGSKFEAFMYAIIVGNDIMKKFKPYDNKPNISTFLTYSENPNGDIDDINYTVWNNSYTNFQVGDAEVNYQDSRAHTLGANACYPQHEAKYGDVFQIFLARSGTKSTISLSYFYGESDKSIGPIPTGMSINIMVHDLLEKPEVYIWQHEKFMIKSRR